MSLGIVVRDEDKRLHQLAKRVGLSVEARADWKLPWKRTLFLDPEIHVPWDLLSAGFDFLDNWEVAAPVHAYEVTAADVAQGQERQRTEQLVGDLRVPLYAHELLFARDCPGGKAFLAAWQEEQRDGDPRLAFLRALCRVKPLFLALPRSWLFTGKEQRARKAPLAQQQAQAGLVRVEVAPGRFIKCVPGNEDQVRAEWRFRRMSRRERSGR